MIKYGGEGDTIPESNKVRLANIEKVQAVIFISESFKDANGNTHEDIIQKFNVGLERYCTGDVLTPGWSLGDGYVARLPWFKSEATPKIPTIPISYRDGKELVKRLNKGGVKFNDGWYSGDSNKRSGILLKISNIEKQAQLIWNIVASIEGREQSEKGIIIGAPRDSTCFGTASSNTGTVALLELIKIFAALQRKYNWVPARTIMFASFDGSEYNLAGLTEWVEKSKDALTKGVYTYIDISDLVSGDQLNINSHPLLQGLIHDVLKKVNNQDNKNFYDIYKDQNSGKDDIFYNLVELKNYIPFISLLNIPSLEIKFKSSSPSFPINSCFDNFENFEAFKFDPEMTKLKQIVEILARVCFELVEAPILPLNFGDFGNSLTKYVVQLEHTINTQISKVSQPNKPVVHFDKIKFAISKFLIGAKRLGDWKANWKQFISESGDVEPTFLALNRWKQNEMFIEFNHKFLAKDVKHERPGYLNLLFGVPFLGTQRDIGHNKELNIFPNVFDYLEVEDFGRAQYVIDYIAELIDHSAEDMLRM